jgi:hypothetical protein
MSREQKNCDHEVALARQQLLQQLQQLSKSFQR